MKKITFLLTLIFIFASLPSFAIKENRIIRVGYANYNKIIAKIQGENVLSSIKDLESSYADKINSLQKEVDSLSQDLQNDPSSSNVNSTVVEYNKKRLDLEILKAQARSEISKKTKSLLDTLKSRIDGVIKQKAKQLGFDIIIDSSMVMIANPDLDITNAVLASL
jgi:Skp family chaperone for outer membrane proteins